MTITITPQTEAKLKEMASRVGCEVNALDDDLLAADPKHDISFEDHRAQFKAEREVSRKREK